MQSVPGSTKQRAKKQKQPQTETRGPNSLTAAPPLSGDQSQVATASQMPVERPQAPQQVPPLAPPKPVSYAPPPIPQTVQDNPSWTAHNPGLAQYHQFVWQIQKTDPTLARTENPSAAIMEQLKAKPAAPSLPVKQWIPNCNKPQIILPPEKFNMGQPPPSLVLSRPFQQPLQPRPPQSVAYHDPGKIQQGWFPNAPPNPFTSNLWHAQSPVLNTQAAPQLPASYLRPLIPRPSAATTPQQNPLLPMPAPSAGYMEFKEGSQGA
jgi:hypothetical protein